MTRSPSRFGALALTLVAGAALGSLAGNRNSPAIFLNSAAAQTADASPSAADQKLATGMVQSNATERHLAPHDTFYLLSYVSAPTDKGVEGFPPGQKVQLVEVHRDKHTLVVTDGHAQVEVDPEKLTNDMDIAALVRQKDQANEAKIAAYIQAEQTAYHKFEREAADATAKDLEQRQQAQADAIRAEQPTPAAQVAPSANQPLSSNNYYGNDGYGYGSPYSYFANGSGSGSAAISVAPASAPAAAPAAPAAAGKVGAPAGKAGGRPK